MEFLIALAMFVAGWFLFLILTISIIGERNAGKRFSFSLGWLLAFVFSLALMMAAVARFLATVRAPH